jgi:two-component system, NtrC family, response regulator AtoC
MSETILVVDDEPSIRHAIVRAFSNFTVKEAETAEQAIQCVRDAYPDIVLLDHHLPDGEGLAVAGKIRAIDAELPVVLLTGHGSVDLAVDALKQGIADYVEKPFKLERLRATVNLLLDKQRLGRQVARLSGKQAGRQSLVAHGVEMKRVMALVKRVAGVPGTTVLIQGESGVGKELVARAIHERSARNEKQFVAINCAALSENLLEAELFGYEKGAFTGADSKGKAGLFEIADGGTIFLDEVGEMPLQLQTKLLRVLQERRFRRVGGLNDVAVDVRVVAATNRDLRHEVAEGRFRQDLYFRLRVVPIQVPALRERPDDILPIADHLLKRLAPELGRPQIQFSKAARVAMANYGWPGNVRELSNAVERAVITAESETIEAHDLCMDEVVVSSTKTSQEKLFSAPPPVAPVIAAEPTLPKGTLVIPAAERNLARVEALLVRTVMEETGGQKSRAAELLGINRTTLYNKLRELDLSELEHEDVAVESA